MKIEVKSPDWHTLAFGQIWKRVMEGPFKGELFLVTASGDGNGGLRLVNFPDLDGFWADYDKGEKLSPDNFQLVGTLEVTL